MSINYLKYYHHLIVEGHKLASKSFLFLGFFLVFLAVMTFTFPAILGTIFAIFIFLAGLFILVTGYYLCQTKSGQSYGLNSLNAEFDFIKPLNNKTNFYRFQSIHFIRW